MGTKTGIGLRLNSMICTLLILSAIVTIFINALLSRNALETEIRDNTMPAMVKEIAANVNLRLSSPTNTLLSLARNPMFLHWVEREDMNEFPQIIQICRTFLQIHSMETINITLQRSRSRHTISSDTTQRKKINSVADAWFDDFGKSNKQVAVNIHSPTDPVYGNTAFINVRLEDSSGHFLGVISASINMATLIRDINGMRIGKYGTTFIVRHDGSILLHPDVARNETSLASLPGFAEHADKALQQKQATFETVDNFGMRILAFGYTLPLLDAMVFTVASIEELLQPVGRAKMYSIAACLFIMVLGLFLSSRLVSSITNSLQRAIHFAGEVSTGSVAEELDSHDTKEMTELSLALNNMNQKLRQSNVSLSGLHSILNSMDALLYVTDPETDIILFINDRMKEHFGLHTAGTGEVCWKVLQSGMTERCSFCPVNSLQADGPGMIKWEEHNTVTNRHYSNTDCLIDWVDGKKAHLQHSVDITNHKMAEEDVKRQLAQQALMSAISRSFISSADMGHLIPNALRMMGEFYGTSNAFFARHVPGDHALAFDHVWVDAKQGYASVQGTAIPFEPGVLLYETFIEKYATEIARDNIHERTLFPNTTNAPLLSLIAVPLVVSGRFWGVLGMVDYARARDWSDSDIHLIHLIGSMVSGVVSRTIAEEKLTRMSLLVETAPMFISYINNKGDFQYINPGASTILGYTETELRAGNLPLIFSEATLERMQDTIIPKIMAEGTVAEELPARCKDGTERILAFSAFTTRFSNYGIGTIALDVTEKRALEKQLLAAKDLAEQSNQAKSDFLSRMSHEMRTPMNAIIGMTTIARSSSELNKKEYCLERIENASTHLLGVINDILDMSKIEANKFELSFTDFVFEKMLTRILNVVNFKIGEKEQELSISLDQAIPFSLVSDEQRLAQVIANLLSNAMKFTPEKGSIALDIRLLEQKNGECELEFTVKDSGIGISKENQSKLFKSFEQADGGIARKFGGTGLGLAISKRIVELLGGEVRVESEEGQGASFIFTIKAQCGAIAPHQLLKSEVNWKNVRILVVDDDIDVRSYFLNLASATGISCDAAKDGPEALALLAPPGEKPAYNIIWIDRKLPGIDGIDLVKTVRERCGEDVAIVMISGEDWSNMQNTAPEAGVDKFLPKPLFSSVIIDTMTEFIDNDTQAWRTDGNASASDGVFIGRTVLLAEDIPLNQEILLTLLEDTGITIECADNGLEAVTMYQNAPDKYELIFMDIHMPEVDGYEASRRIRSLDVPGAATIPIIAMTANVFREDIERCLNAGMNDHLGKPIDREDIITKLYKYLPPLP